jgi:hypothetical protein
VEGKFPESFEFVRVGRARRGGAGGWAGAGWDGGLGTWVRTPSERPGAGGGVRGVLGREVGGPGR